MGERVVHLTFVFGVASLTKLDAIVESCEIACQGTQSHRVETPRDTKSTFKDNTP
jgi:hypothetical protein